VLAAAWLAIPTVILYFSSLEGPWAALALGLAWGIWLVFVAEAAIMLRVVRDRRAWARGHLFGIAIILLTFPLLTNLLEGLLAARALSSLQGVRLLQVLYLAKALKIIKSVLIVRRTGAVRMHPALSSLGILVVATVLVGIGHRVSTGEKQATPFHSAWDAIDGLEPWAQAMLLAALAGTCLVTWFATGRRRTPGT